MVAGGAGGGRPGSGDGRGGADDSVAPTAGAAHADTGAVVYRERLSTPWWWYPLALVVAAILAAEFGISGLNLTIVLPFAILLPLAVVMVWWLGHYVLEVSDGELRVRGAHLELAYVSGVVGLDAPTLRLVVGREGDPAAFVSIRPWIGPGVQLWLDDVDDPTPYWVVSTRHPQRLLDVLRAGMA